MPLLTIIIPEHVAQCDTEDCFNGSQAIHDVTRYEAARELREDNWTINMKTKKVQCPECNGKGWKY